MRLSVRLAVLALLAPLAAAGDAVIPSGFNLETRPAAGPLAGILEDGTVLLSTGFFGADELSVRHPDGSVTLFATGFGALAGIAQSPLTGEIVVGDSLYAPALAVLRDLNGDGDALDPGEHVAHAASLPPMPNGQPLLPFDIAFRPGTDECFVSGSTTFTVPPSLGAVARVVGSTSNVYAGGLGIASGLCFVGDTLYVADLNPATFAGRVHRFVDANGSGAIDAPGESSLFADGLSGASDVVRAADGCFYVSGGFDASFEGAITRLAADADGNGASDEVLESYFTGFAFAGSLTLEQGAGGFVPGAAGEGQLWVGDYTVTGNRIVRSAPHAALAVTGNVAVDDVFTLHVSGAPGASALAVLSLSDLGPTLHGIGDLCVGFGAPNVVLSLGSVPTSGVASLAVSLHGAAGAAGLSFFAQGFVVEGGEVGISNTQQLSIASR